MDVDAVRKKSEELWNKHRLALMAIDSTSESIPLSQLLDQMAEDTPAAESLTDKQPGVTETLTGEGSREDLLVIPEPLQLKPELIDVKRFLVSAEDWNQLENIIEWQSDYVPPMELAEPTSASTATNVANSAQSTGNTAEPSQSNTVGVVPTQTGPTLCNMSVQVGDSLLAPSASQQSTAERSQLRTTEQCAQVGESLMAPPSSQQSSNQVEPTINIPSGIIFHPVFLPDSQVKNQSQVRHADDADTDVVVSTQVPGGGVKVVPNFKLSPVLGRNTRHVTPGKLSQPPPDSCVSDSEEEHRLTDYLLTSSNKKNAPCPSNRKNNTVYVATAKSVMDDIANATSSPRICTASDVNADSEGELFSPKASATSPAGASLYKTSTAISPPGASNIQRDRNSTEKDDSNQSSSGLKSSPEEDPLSGLAQKVSSSESPEVSQVSSTGGGSHSGTHVITVQTTEEQPPRTSNTVDTDVISPETMRIQKIINAGKVVRSGHHHDIADDEICDNEEDDHSQTHKSNSGLNKVTGTEEQRKHIENAEGNIEKDTLCDDDTEDEQGVYVAVHPTAKVGGKESSNTLSTGGGEAVSVVVVKQEDNISEFHSESETQAATTSSKQQTGSSKNSNPSNQKQKLSLRKKRVSSREVVDNTTSSDVNTDDISSGKRPVPRKLRIRNTARQQLDKCVIEEESSSDEIQSSEESPSSPEVVITKAVGTRRSIRSTSKDALWEPSLERQIDKKKLGGTSSTQKSSAQKQRFNFDKGKTVTENIQGMLGTEKKRPKYDSSVLFSAEKRKSTTGNKPNNDDNNDNAAGALFQHNKSHLRKRKSASRKKLYNSADNNSSMLLVGDAQESFNDASVGDNGGKERLDTLQEEDDEDLQVTEEHIKTNVAVKDEPGVVSIDTVISSRSYPTRSTTRSTTSEIGDLADIKEEEPEEFSNFNDDPNKKLTPEKLVKKCCFIHGNSTIDLSSDDLRKLQHQESGEHVCPQPVVVLEPLSMKQEEQDNDEEDFNVSSLRISDCYSCSPAAVAQSIDTSMENQLLGIETGAEKQDEGHYLQMASDQAHFTPDRQAKSAEKNIEDIISVSSSTCGSPVMVNKNDGRISTQPQGRKESCEIIDIDEGEILTDSPEAEEANITVYSTPPESINTPVFSGYIFKPKIAASNSSDSPVVLIADDDVRIIDQGEEKGTDVHAAELPSEASDITSRTSHEGVQYVDYNNIPADASYIINISPIPQSPDIITGDPQQVLSTPALSLQPTVSDSQEMFNRPYDPAPLSSTLIQHNIHDGVQSRKDSNVEFHFLQENVETEKQKIQTAVEETEQSSSQISPSLLTKPKTVVGSGTSFHQMNRNVIGSHSKSLQTEDGANVGGNLDINNSKDTSVINSNSNTSPLCTDSLTSATNDNTPSQPPRISVDSNPDKRMSNSTNLTSLRTPQNSLPSGQPQREHLESQSRPQSATDNRSSEGPREQESIDLPLTLVYNHRSSEGPPEQDSTRIDLPLTLVYNHRSSEGPPKQDSTRIDLPLTLIYNPRSSEGPPEQDSTRIDLPLTLVYNHRSSEGPPKQDSTRIDLPLTLIYNPRSSEGTQEQDSSTTVFRKMMQLNDTFEETGGNVGVEAEVQQQPHVEGDIGGRDILDMIDDVENSVESAILSEIHDMLDEDRSDGKNYELLQMEFSECSHAGLQSYWNNLT